GVQTAQSLRSVQAVQAVQITATCGCEIDFGFWIPTESALKSKKSVRDARPLFFTLHIFRSSSSQQNSDCQLQLLPSTVRLALPTHLEERSLSIADRHNSGFFIKQKRN